MLLKSKAYGKLVTLTKAREQTMRVYQIQVLRNGEWVALSNVVRKSEQEAQAMLDEINASNDKLNEFIRSEYRLESFLLI
jgi:hypothetical protein